MMDGGQGDVNRSLLSTLVDHQAESDQECGAARDVGEEKGDGAGGEVGHDPLQTLGWMWFGTIVA
jgi:hypothetical protein